MELDRGQNTTLTDSNSMIGKYKLNYTNDSSSLTQSKFSMQNSMDKTVRLSDHQKSTDEGTTQMMEDDLEDDIFLGGALTCCGSFRFFLKHSW